MGISTSTNGCLKTAPLLGMPEMWAVRCDASGNALWDRSYLPTLMDFYWAFNLEPTHDGGYLGCGGGGPNDRSAYYYGIVKFDDQGNKLWDQSFGGSALEGKPMRPFTPPPFEPERIRRTADGGFLLVGASMSPVSGTKTVPLIGDEDFWVLKLGPEPPSLRGEFTAEGQFKLCLIGPPEFEHTIQGSADLVTWKDLVTWGPTPAGKEYWTDQEKLAHRFYRAVRR